MLWLIPLLLGCWGGFLYRKNQVSSRVPELMVQKRAVPKVIAIPSTKGWPVWPVKVSGLSPSSLVQGGMVQIDAGSIRGGTPQDTRFMEVAPFLLSRALISCPQMKYPQQTFCLTWGVAYDDGSSGLECSVTYKRSDRTLRDMAFGAVEGHGFDYTDVTDERLFAVVAAGAKQKKAAFRDLRKFGCTSHSF